MPVTVLRKFPASKASRSSRPARRRVVRRRAFKRRTAMVARRPVGPSFLPTIFRTKLRYQQFQVLSSAPAMATQVIRANSLFDPNLTGVGHQPRGLDELSALYKEYRVFGVYLDASFKVTTNNFAWVGYTLIANNVSGPTTINGAIECRRGFNKMIGDDRVYRIRKYFPVSQIAGVPKNVVRFDDAYKALTTANPAEGCVIQLHAASPDESTTTVVHLNYTLTYYCHFSAPKFLAQS